MLHKERARAHGAYEALRTTGYLTGRYSRRNPDIRIESVIIGTGDTAYIGDSVRVAKSMKDGEPVEETAGRLAGLFFDGGKGKRVSIAGGLADCIMPSPESLQAETRPFVCPTRVEGGGRKSVRGDLCRVWEPVGEHDIQIVDVCGLRRLCKVIPDETLLRVGVPSAPSSLQTPAVAGLYASKATARGGHIMWRADHGIAEGAVVCYST